MRQRVKKYIGFYLSPTLKLLGIIFSLLGLVGTSIVAFFYFRSDLQFSAMSFEDDALEKGTALNYYLPYLIPGLVFIIFLLVGLLIVLRNVRKKERMIHLLSTSEPIDAKVVRNIQNFYVQMNNMPRREVLFSTNDGNRYEYHFFGEQLASLFRENMVLPIVVDKKKAYPAISFFEAASGNGPTNSGGIETPEPTSKTDGSAFDKFIESARNFETAGDKQGAISFYEGALSFKQDKTTAQLLIVLYRQMNQLEKANTLEKEIESWS
ncbi:MAG: hypothetical protein Crog4KO_11710 [Crocinitomicaceae bacterium]